ncbi:unnamed protein product, partial [Gongylonema pulchrum]|uniref:Col_cuticle_N domain-containing protein n=1 Tax=Gongylonema pulchrum TaxID=637853 RepID=A0A183EQW4_9BILA
MNVRLLAIVALAVGAVCVIVGILAITVVPLAVNKQFCIQGVIAIFNVNFAGSLQDIHLGFDKNGTYNEMTRRWVEPEYAMELRVWVVSVANPEDVVQRGSYPVLVEKGPYIY